MNGKDLLDAMNDIDDRFVDEAENGNFRASGGKVFLRWAALAACVGICVFALGSNLSGLLPDGIFPEIATQPDDSGSQEHNGWIETILPQIGMDEGVSDETSSDYVAVRYYHLHSGMDDVQYPMATVIRSRAELDMYIARHMTEPYTGEALIDLDFYDDAFFAQKDLIIAALIEGSGSYRHAVTGVSCTDGIWTISIDRILPGEGYAVTADIAWWHIFIEVDEVGLFDRVELDISVRRD